MSKHFLRYALAEQAFLEADAMINHVFENKFSLDSHLYQACVAGIVTSYCRPFTANEGLGRLPSDFDKFDGNDVQMLERIHQELTNARNKVLGHFDLKYSLEKFNKGEYKKHPGQIVLLLHPTGYHVQTPLQTLLPVALESAKKLIEYQIAKVRKCQNDFAFALLKMKKGELGYYVLTPR